MSLLVLTLMLVILLVEFVLVLILVILLVEFVLLVVGVGVEGTTAVLGSVEYARRDESLELAQVIF